MAKHNWSKLKIAFINGNYKSLKDFAEKRNISYKTLQQKAVGWVKEKQEREREKTKGSMRKAGRKRDCPYFIEK